jgi:branched-chain amino acid transport system ATP-binding protein
VPVLLELSNVCAGYGRLEILHGITLSIETGEFVALLGPNGAGKTTTIRTILGGCDIKSGKVTFDGSDITSSPVHERAGMRIATSPEGRRIWPSMTVAENLILGAWSLDRSRRTKEAKQSLDHVLEIFPRLRERLRQPAGVLSGGEAQMVAIGRALMAKPRLLLIDEPSIGLAPIAVEAVAAVLHRLRDERNCAILLVEQQTQVALSLADRAYILSQGLVQAEGTGEELSRDPDLAAIYFGSQTIEPPAASAG